MGKAEKIYRHKARLEQAAKIDREKADLARRKALKRSDREQKDRVIAKIEAAIPAALERLRQQGFPGGELRSRYYWFWPRDLVSWKILEKEYTHTWYDKEVGKLHEQRSYRVYLFSDGSIGYGTTHRGWKDLSTVTLEAILSGIQRLGV